MLVVDTVWRPTAAQVNAPAAADLVTRRAARDISVVLAAVWITGVLLLTQSRSGWFGWIVGMGAMLAWSSRLLRRLILLLCVVALLAVIGIGPGRIGAALFGDAPKDTFGALNWVFRLEVWRAAVWGISDFPFTGMGIGVFREVGRMLYPLAIPPDYDFAHAHNEFLQVALDLGLAGLIAFAAPYFVAFWMLRQIWQSASTLHPPPSNP